MVILFWCPFVRLSVLVSCPDTDPSPGEIETSGFHHMIAQSLYSISRQKISWRWVEGIHMNKREK